MNVTMVAILMLTIQKQCFEGVKIQAASRTAIDD